MMSTIDHCFFSVAFLWILWDAFYSIWVLISYFIKHLYVEDYPVVDEENVYVDVQKYNIVLFKMFLRWFYANLY